MKRIHKKELKEMIIDFGLANSVEDIDMIAFLNEFSLNYVETMNKMVKKYTNIGKIYD